MLQSAQHQTAKSIIHVDLLPIQCLTVNIQQRQKKKKKKGRRVLLSEVSACIDSISSLVLLNPQGSNDNITYTMSEKGIAWSSDVSRYRQTSMPADQLAPPPNWIKRYPNGYTADNLFDPTQDEHFLVWMRTSWYPTFRKLYSNYYGDPLQPGTYQLQVDLSKWKGCFESRKRVSCVLRKIIF